MAVADGGGSYKFSRIGAKAACTGAVQHLAKALADCAIKPQDKLTEKILEDESVKLARMALHDAMKAAWQAVQKAFNERRNSWDHIQFVKPHRHLSLKDLYSTLLLAIRVCIETDDGPRSLIFGCAAGDGMITVITKDGHGKLLMKPDSGEFSSEVEFFTEKTLSSLDSRTYPFAGGTKAFMLMTDGVADDYFPYEKRMPELFADLVLNGIISPGMVDDETMASELASTKIKDLNGIKGLDFLVETERLLKEPVKVKLASAKKFAEALGIEPQELAKRPALLAAATKVVNQPMPEVKGSEKRLLVWLDSYYVRSSFDDRTILVMADGGK